jgi:GTPase SAR1 family protein
MFENFITRIPVKNGVIELSLWDTAGQEEYDRLRPLSYPDTDICIIAFSIASTQTFHSVIEKVFFTFNS